MSNIEVDLSKVNNDLMEIWPKGEPCKYLIEQMVGNDFGAPPRFLVIRVSTESGKKVEVTIPYDVKGIATVNIDNEKI